MARGHLLSNYISTRKAGLVTGIILCVGGCDEAFNPKGVYDEQLVVYSVLTAETDTQFVRLFLTYNPPGFEPNEVITDNAITNALVSISGSPPLRDTTIARLDKSRYSNGIHAFVASPFKVLPGTTYNLSVSTPSKGNAAATTTAPGKGTIFIGTPFVLGEPDRYSDEVNLNLILSPVTRGYLIRLYIRYEITVGGNTLVQYEEAPQTVQTVDGEVIPNFPKLTRRVSFSGPGAENREFVSFQKAAYEYGLNQVRLRHQSDQLKFRSILFVMTQVEPNLYSYYNIVNGFQDPNSIRTDQPDYSNIRGGIGVFGAMTHDSTVFTLPLDFH